MLRAVDVLTVCRDSQEKKNKKIIPSFFLFKGSPENVAQNEEKQFVVLRWDLPLSSII
jgi:hypothetical protein